MKYLADVSALMKMIERATHVMDGYRWHVWWRLFDDR